MALVPVRLDNQGASGQTFLYAGQQLAGEYDSSGNLLARHIPGPGLDMPVASLFAGGLRYQQLADERGSVIGLTNASGGLAGVNRYDEYGVASAGDRFQYTGQAYLAPGLYHYRARAYAPQLGRFLQTDPIGYQAGPNIYAYVGGDPINLTDPSGLVPGGGDCVPDPDFPTETCLPGVDVTGQSCSNSFFGYCVSYPTGPGLWDPRTFDVQLGRPGSGQERRRTPQEECQANIPEGDTRFYCDEDGRMQMSDWYAEQTCANYHAMMESVRELRWWSYGAASGSTGYSIFRPNSWATAPRALNVVTWAQATTLLLLSASPPPPGCQR